MLCGRGFLRRRRERRSGWLDVPEAAVLAISSARSLGGKSCLVERGVLGCLSL
jgi:hypothetical protein